MLEFRVGWVILGLLLAVLFRPPGAFFWGPAVGIPWLIGAVILGSQRIDSVTATLSQVWADTGVRPGILILTAVAALIAHVFSLATAVFLITWFFMIGVVAAGLGKRGGIRTTLIGLSLASAVLVVGFGSLEMFFRIPSVAARWGTPAELSAWDSRYDRVWKENVFGFRSRHETVARSSGVNRAVVLGDSFTWGDKIAETDDTWPARLEAILNRTGDEAWEVISMAQRGYTTANEAELLRRLGWQFDPDLVLVQFYINDVLPSGDNFARVGARWLLPPVNLLPVRFRSGSIQRSAIFSLIESHLSSLVNRWRKRSWDSLYRDEAEGWEQLTRAMHEIGNSSSERGVPVILVLFPDLAPGQWTTESYPYRKIHSKVASAARDAGLQVLDLVPYFASEPADWKQWWATPYDPHPGVRAHAKAAEAVASHVTRLRDSLAGDKGG